VRPDEAAFSQWRTFSSRVGPATALFEAVAACIGSGLVIGGFAAGVGEALWRRPRRHAESRAVIGSYIGGTGALLALALDIVRKYFV
jgi:F0F1-type ATP synthase membrane subunit c/vacuolar-type H+-ATPase subunit K